jgi:hypothetical protein
MYLMQVKSPAASTSRYDIYDIRGEVSPSAAWKPLSLSPHDDDDVTLQDETVG